MVRSLFFVLRTIRNPHNKGQHTGLGCSYRFRRHHHVRTRLSKRFNLLHHLQLIDNQLSESLRRIPVQWKHGKGEGEDRYGSL